MLSIRSVVGLLTYELVVGIIATTSQSFCVIQCHFFLKKCCNKNAFECLPNPLMETLQTSELVFLMHKYLSSKSLSKLFCNRLAGGNSQVASKIKDNTTEIRNAEPSSNFLGLIEMLSFVCNSADIPPKKGHCICFQFSVRWNPAKLMNSQKPLEKFCLCNPDFWLSLIFFTFFLYFTLGGILKFTSNVALVWII